MFKMRHFLAYRAMRQGTFKMSERGCQMRHFRAIAQDLAALVMEQRSPPLGDLNRRRKERKRGKRVRYRTAVAMYEEEEESFPAGSEEKKGIFPHIQGEEVHLKRERMAMRKKNGSRKRRITGKRNKKIGLLLFVAMAWMWGTKYWGETILKTVKSKKIQFLREKHRGRNSSFYFILFFGKTEIYPTSGKSVARMENGGWVEFPINFRAKACQQFSRALQLYSQE